MNHTELIRTPDLPEAGEPGRWPTSATIHELCDLAGRRPLSGHESLVLSALLDIASADPQARAKGRAALLAAESQNLQAVLQAERIRFTPGYREWRFETECAVVILPDNGKQFDEPGKIEDGGGDD